MKNLSLSLLFLGLLLFAFSCKEDEPEPEPACVETYASSVKAIVDKSCAYSGCHSGADAGMFVPDEAKDYTTYAGLLDNLKSNAFRMRALDSLDMPPIYTPDGNPKSLSAAEIETITCWLDNDYPE